MELNDLEKIDSKNMFRIYDQWPEIAKESFEKEFRVFESDDIDHVVFAGMGGSGTIGDTISALLSKKDIHVSNIKGYLLPKTVDDKTLVILTSVSGNTSETISILNNAKKTQAKIVSFSSGGKMEKICNDDRIFFEKIPIIHSPRVSYTNFLYSIMNILKPILPIEDKDIYESISQLEKTRNIIFSKNLNSENKALELANFITNIVCIYYPAGLQTAAIRYKNSLQENAKMHVITEDIIEACHNGIVAWEKDSNVKPVLIRGKNDYIKTIERWDIIEEFFQEKNIDYKTINSLEGNILSKMVNLIYLLDYSSIYSAVLNNTDPSPVNSIDFIKNRL